MVFYSKSKKLLSCITFSLLPSRCPEAASKIDLMLYGSLKDTLLKKLVGIKHTIQATNKGELDYEKIVENISTGEI